MSSKRILFIGGSGVISTASVRLAVRRGHAVTVLNRGRSDVRPLPPEVETLHADATDGAAVDAALAGRDFDVVAQFRAFSPGHVAADIARFAGHTGHYVFISSASAYQKPPLRLPVTESTPLRNPYWQYSRDKIACEDVLVAAYRATGFPATIVRPSHTYDATLIPTTGGWTDVMRMRTGKPVVVHGDGTSQWTLTHSDDFAVAFVGLLAHPVAIGDSFTITGTHAPTWNQIYGWLGEAAGVSPELVHIASESIAIVLPEQGDGLIGDKSHSAVFDCSKITALVPQFRTSISYHEAAHEQIAWFDARPERQVVDPELDAAFGRLVAAARAFGR